MDAFAAGEDIYCASASKMFGVPVVKHGINGHLRQKGKVAELACGYGGSVGAMKAMGGEDLNLSDAELKQIVMHHRILSGCGGMWMMPSSRQSAAKVKQKHTVCTSATRARCCLSRCHLAESSATHTRRSAKTSSAANR